MFEYPGEDKRLPSGFMRGVRRLQTILRHLSFSPKSQKLFSLGNRRCQNADDKRPECRRNSEDGERSSCHNKRYQCTKPQLPSKRFLERILQRRNDRDSSEREHIVLREYIQ